MRNHRKTKKSLNSEEFRRMVDILIVNVKNKPLVSFKALERTETSRIEQKKPE